MDRPNDGKRGEVYLALHQHGDVYEHIVQLLDATFQTDDVFVSGFNLTQGLFRDPRVHNLCEGEVLWLPVKFIAIISQSENGE